MTTTGEPIRWFRALFDLPWLTEGKLYPATEVDIDGDLAVVDDDGGVRWVVISNPASHLDVGHISSLFEEVLPDE